MSVAAIRNPRLVPPSAIPLDESDQKTILQSVANRTLIELGVSLAIGAATVAFTATPLHGTLMFAAIAVQTICNAALRYADAMAAKEPPSKEREWVRRACRYLCPTLFAYLTAVNAQTLIHESGHALAAAAFFKNANPRITITPSLGGLTRFSTEHLSTLGEKIGRDAALFLTTLMGPAASLLVSAIAIIAGFSIERKLPELASYLVSVGSGDFYAHSFYALSACSSSAGSQAHDFIRLKNFGIHPLAASVAILSIPIILSSKLKK